MKSKQLEFGNETEDKVALLFKKKHYWSYITPKKLGGQPVDIIAISDKGKWLVDAKHLEETEKSFPFSRIEANQLTTMQYARGYAGVQGLGFVICVGNDFDKFYFLSYDKYLDLSQKGLKSAKIGLLEDFEVVLDNECRNN